MRKPCPHGSVLPRGLKCDRGYLFIRVFTEEGKYQRGCGAHTPQTEKLATMALNKVREQLFLGAFKLPKKQARWKFKQAAEYYYQRHFIDYRDPNTHKPRSTSTLRTTPYVLNMLVDYFGDFYFDAVTVKTVKAYKTHCVEFEGISGATFNRRKALLSSIFGMIRQWVKEEDMEIIRLPEDNPCDFVPDLSETPRTRVASIEELKRLKAACFELNDPGLWSIIYMELDSGLRLGDLEKLPQAVEKNGVVAVTQGKTGNTFYLPAIVKPKTASVFENLRKRFVAAREKAGLQDLQFRDLRKTAANMLKKIGGTLDNMKDALGHASSKTTERHYVLPDGEKLRPLIEKRRELILDKI